MHSSATHAAEVELGVHLNAASWTRDLVGAGLLVRVHLDPTNGVLVASGRQHALLVREAHQEIGRSLAFLFRTTNGQRPVVVGRQEHT